MPFSCPYKLLASDKETKLKDKYMNDEIEKLIELTILATKAGIKMAADITNDSLEAEALAAWKEVYKIKNSLFDKYSKEI